MDLENFFRGDPEFKEDQETELLRFTQALRGVLEKSINLNCSSDNLKQLADAAEQLDSDLKPHLGKSPLAAYSQTVKFSDIGWTYAYSPITGRANAIAPPMHTVIENNLVISKVVFGNAYEGPPGCVHGGIVSLAWDHVLAAATLINDSRGPTANLNINYIKPTPLHTELRFEAWIEKQEGKKVFAKGRCFDGDTLLTEANGLFINTLIKELDVTEDQLKQNFEE